jgi:hypothetical protein
MQGPWFKTQYHQKKKNQKTKGKYLVRLRPDEVTPCEKTHGRGSRPPSGWQDKVAYGNLFLRLWEMDKCLAESGGTAQVYTDPVFSMTHNCLLGFQAESRWSVWGFNLLRVSWSVFKTQNVFPVLVGATVYSHWSMSVMAELAIVAAATLFTATSP